MVPLIFMIGAPLAGAALEAGEYDYSFAPILWAVALPLARIGLARREGEVVDRALEPLLEARGGAVPEDLRREPDVGE